MVKRYFIWLSYDGTHYHGWQVQPNGISVQGELQRVLSTLLRQDISITGAGRTDAGVHARVMAAHFDFDGDIDCKQLAYKMNRMLGVDIVVDRIEEVASDLHARFSATERTYHYYIHTKKNPFLRHFSCEIHYPLDFEKMNEAGRILTTYEDFGAFCKAHSDVKTTLCHVTRAEWIQTGDTTWYFVITANRFLRNMVRAVVGTLVDVGRGRLSLDEFRAVIEGKRRSDAGDSMPGNALFLEDVKY
ncbi:MULTISPECIES: tRNA pseudouridine(38-40) synthase TruA [unclassified Prevotella]|uniref:tRNA pseudouridine(38-40) synthase TruA n=1 Tax=unclassified Prevotella TaxID=2638335 RepID=UPI00048C1336|nr:MULTISPECIES: tRNA pseudouridine(38-40) synthase TruA [unclassified Prevotella]